MLDFGRDTTPNFHDMNIPLEQATTKDESLEWQSSDYKLLARLNKEVASEKLQASKESLLFLKASMTHSLTAEELENVLDT